MSITELKNNRRVWSEDFINSYKELSIDKRYARLVKGLCESGFKRYEHSPSTPLNRVTDLRLDKVVVRLYLVDLNGDHVICYRVGLEDTFDNEDTDTIFHLGLDTIWEEIRRFWFRSQ